MPLTPHEIESQALELPANDRAELVERLAGSLSDDELSPSRQAWLQLARKRRDDIRSGAVVGIPGEEGSMLVRKLVGR